MNEDQWSSRVKGFDYNNRYADYYSIVPENSQRILNFGIGEDPELLNETDIKTFIQYINSSKSVFGYSENFYPGLIEAFQFFAYKHYATFIPHESLMITCGIKDILNKLAYLLIDRGDQVLVTSPGYNVFNRICKFYGADVITAQLTERNNFVPGIVAYCQKHDIKPKIILLNYPNNPTGRSVSHSYFADLLSFVRSYGGILINDAAYLDYSYARTPVSLLAQGTANAVELYSASKTFGLTGGRVGMVGGDKNIIAKLNYIRDQFDSGSSKIFLWFYKYLLEKDRIDNNREKYRARYHHLAPILRKHNFVVSPQDATFYMYCKMPLDQKYGSSTEYATYIRKKLSVFTIPYEDNYLRFSLTYGNDYDPDELDSRLSQN